MTGGGLHQIMQNTGIYIRSFFMIKSWNAIYVQQDRKYSTWEQEHREFLKRKAPAEFDILHYGAIAELKKKFQEEAGDEYSGT